jgi:hypothetical protein
LAAAVLPPPLPLPLLPLVQAANAVTIPMDAARAIPRRV